MKKHLAWLLAAALCGCTGHYTNVKNTLPQAGNNLAIADAHAQSAESLVAQAIKEPAGVKFYLPAAVKELMATHTANSAVSADIKKVQGERDQLELQNKNLNDDLTKAKLTWGYRLQVWVDRLLFWIKTVLISALLIHFAANIASIFVSGPFGPILSKIGVIVNPFAWFQAAISHLNYKKQLQAVAGK